MARFLAAWRASSAAEAGMTPIEYGLVAVFICVSLIAAVPGAALALEAAGRRLLDQFA